MKYNLSLGNTISIFFTYCFAYLLLFADVMTIYQGQILHPIYLFGIPLLLFVLILFEKLCSRFTTFIFLHFLLAIGLIFIPLPSSLYRFLFYLLLTIESIRDCYLWTHFGYKPYKTVPWILITFSFISYLCSVIYQVPTLSTIAYFSALAIMVFHFIRFSISGLEHQFNQPGNTTSIPGKKIILTTFSVLGIFLVVFVFTCLFFHIFDLEYLLYDFGEALKNVLRFIIEFVIYILAFFRALFARNTEATEEIEEKNKNMIQALDQAANTSLWSQIATNLCKLVAFSFLLYCMYRILSTTLRTYMTKYVAETDEITLIEHKDTKKKKRKKQKRSTKTLRDYLAGDSISKIRRAYRTRIRHYKDLNPKTNETSKDLELRIFKQYHDDIHTLTGIYQKARYSNQKVSKEDLVNVANFSATSSNEKQYIKEESK